MNEHVHHHPDEHPENHEHSDVSVRGIAITMTALVVVGLIVHVGLWVLFGVYERQADDVDQQRQLTDIREMKRETEKQLKSSYRREDGNHKIPIDDAMKLLVERNMLPARAPATQEGGQ